MFRRQPKHRSRYEAKLGDLPWAPLYGDVTKLLTDPCCRHVGVNRWNYMGVLIRFR